MMVLLMVCSASATTITVNASGGADYTGIQDAVNASNNGDTIMVAGGTYNENVVVNKSVNLMGAGADITTVQAANSNDHVFNVTVSGINITGFTLMGATANQKAGIYLKYSNNNELTGNNVSNNEYGFYLYYSDNNNLTGNNVSNNNNPISFYYSNNNNLIGNDVSKNNWGIYIGGSSNNNLKENNISNINEGIYLSSSSNNNLKGNKVLNTFYGITLYYSNNNNLIGNNASNKSYGIYLYYSNNNNLIGNNVSKNDQNGISIAYSRNNNLTDNYAVNNNNGINLYSAMNNTIYNNFFKNYNNAGFSGSINNNYWNSTITSGTNIIGGPYLGGNFWADPDDKSFSQTCEDTNKDGICDLNYTLNSGNIDYLPLAAMPAGYGIISGSVLNNSLEISYAIVTTNTSNSTTTDASGNYSFLVPAGTYNLTVTRYPEYYSNTLVNVTAIAGIKVVQNIELIKKPAGNITGIVSIV